MGTTSGGWRWAGYVCLGASLWWSAPLRAQSRETLLVGARAMAEGMQARNAIVLHVGPEDAYPDEHVAGARFIDPWDFLEPSSRGHRDGHLTTELPTPAALEATLEGLGISDDSQIYLYWADEWFTPTMRVLYTLDWAGLGDRVHLLDGGLPTWKAAGLPVTGDAPAAATEGHLTLRPRDALVVDAAWVEAHGRDGGQALVDARSPAAYTGQEDDHGLRGHIAGAGSLPAFDLLTEDGHFKSDGDLRSLFRAAGVEDGDTVVAYCHIGQYATAVLFAGRLTGHPGKLYDGSMQDWAQRQRPVVAGGR